MPPAQTREIPVQFRRLTSLCPNGSTSSTSTSGSVEGPDCSLVFNTVSCSLCKPGILREQQQRCSHSPEASAHPHLHRHHPPAKRISLSLFLSLSLSLSLSFSLSVFLYSFPFCCGLYVRACVRERERDDVFAHMPLHPHPGKQICSLGADLMINNTIFCQHQHYESNFIRTWAELLHQLKRSLEAAPLHRRNQRE